MKHCTSLADLKQLLPTITDDLETSFAMVFSARPWHLETVFQVYEAARVCDKVVFVSLSGEPLDGTADQWLSAAGVAVVFQPQTPESTPCRLSHTALDLDVTLLLQLILTVMPLSVHVSHTEKEVAQCLDGIASTFRDIFTLHHTPGRDLPRTAAARAVRAALDEVRQKGEKALENYAFDIIERYHISHNGQNYLCLHVNVAGEKVYDFTPLPNNSLLRL